MGSQESDTPERLNLPAAAAAAAKSLQSCPTLCDPIDSSPPGSTVPGILQENLPTYIYIYITESLLYSRN